MFPYRSLCERAGIAINYAHKFLKSQDLLQCRQCRLMNNQVSSGTQEAPYKKLPQNPCPLLAGALGLSAIILGLAAIASADDAAAKPYKILSTTQIPAAGRIDYVTAYSDNRRVYVACGNAVSVFDLD